MTDYKTYGEGRHESADRSELRRILGPQWKIQDEVWGRGPDGKPVRVDAVIRPIDATQWKDPSVAFAVECKSMTRQKQICDRSHWLRQCVDYTYTNWQGYGFLWVLTFPSVFGPWYTKSSIEHERHLFGAFGVGEIVNDRWGGWSIHFSTHRIWSEKQGVVSGSRWTCKKTFGA